jgi:hypothetical protein
MDFIEWSWNQKADLLDLHQTSLEEGLVKSIINMAQELERDEQFAFYDLGFSEYEELFHHTYLSSLVTRLVKDILSTNRFEDIKSGIRTHEAYLLHAEQKKCIEWHINESYEEFLSINQKRGLQEKERCFLITLASEGALFHNINEAQHTEFLKLANNTMRFIGHTSIETCGTSEGEI